MATKFYQLCIKLEEFELAIVWGLLPPDLIILLAYWTG